jgi:hypothetical protein
LLPALPAQAQLDGSKLLAYWKLDDAGGSTNSVSRIRGRYQRRRRQ